MGRREIQFLKILKFSLAYFKVMCYSYIKKGDTDMRITELQLLMENTKEEVIRYVCSKQTCDDVQSTYFSDYTEDDLVCAYFDNKLSENEELEYAVLDNIGVSFNIPISLEGYDLTEENLKFLETEYAIYNGVFHVTPRGRYVLLHEEDFNRFKSILVRL